MEGKAMTVLGPVDVSLLGRTLTHEHLPFGSKGLFIENYPPSQKHLAESTFSIENLWWIRQFPYYHRENNQLGGAEVEEAVLQELAFFKQNGGGTIVDNTITGINRIPDFLKKAALESGVHLIAGTGFYVAASQSESHLRLTTSQMAAHMKQELTEGFDGTTMKCGIIGEIGTSWPLHDFERRCLQAAGEVQEELGCPVNIHPGRDSRSPSQIIRVFQEAGGKAQKTVMSHLERTIMDNDSLLDFLSCGAYCEFDLFGTEVSYYMLDESIDMPSDAQRLVRLNDLLQYGLGDRIVIGHDIHTRHRLMKYGGHGFSHILLNVVPKMLKRGFSQEDVDKILIHNPATWLSY